MNRSAYVLITPARNEEAVIENTLRAVISQSCLPEKWVIVSDGSTDRTDEIVAKYAASHPFIRLIKLDEHRTRNFGSKVNAFRTGYDSIGDVNYEFLGNVDADVSFGDDYFSRLLIRFSENPKLGIAGGIILEVIKSRFVTQKTSFNSVAGAIQLFRRECYEDIGGYIPIRSGGIDSAAEIMARSRGWDVQTFPDLKVLHHRRVGNVGTDILRARFRQGVTHYLLGYRPFFETLKCIYRLAEPPYIIGSTFVFSGYVWSWIRRLPRPMPKYALEYFRREQAERILATFRIPTGRGKAS